MKQMLILVVVLAKVRSKFFTIILQRSIQAFDCSITQRATAGTNPDFHRAAFSCFDSFVERSIKPDFRHNLWINSL
jgi:hypothetical protein